MKADHARHDSTEAQQRGEVEDVGAEDHTGANLLLVLGDGADSRRDLRRVRSQRGDHAEYNL